jgi:hypothetical protein
MTWNPHEELNLKQFLHQRFYKKNYGSACLKQAIQRTEEVPADREYLLNSRTDLLNQCSVWLQGNKPTGHEMGEDDAEDDDRITVPVGRNYTEGIL